MKKAKMVLHHDSDGDLRCEARLDDKGDCPKCKVHPDMQSLCLWPYCPRCDCPLENMKCPSCGYTFKRP